MKNLNAKNFEAQFPRAVAAIVHRHYVDDYLVSFGMIEEAVEIGCKVNAISAKVGFEIRNFLSNEPTVAARVVDESLEAVKKVLPSRRMSGLNGHEVDI